MVTLVNNDLQQAVASFEQLVDALDRYRASLEAQRERHRAAGRDPKGFERPIGTGLKRVEQLRNALDGEVYDMLRGVLDSTGVLASVEKGDWI